MTNTPLSSTNTTSLESRPGLLREASSKIAFTSLSKISTIPFETAIASEQLNYPTLSAKMAAIQPGGPLYSLPREIRDEIYRYLVKGRYLSFHSWMDYTRRLSFEKIDLAMFQKADLAIFRVSKATFDEATSIFYSESVFRYHIDQYHNTALCSPGEASNRMMKIDVDIGRLGPNNMYLPRVRPDGIEADLCTALDKFSGLSNLRNTISIKIQLAPFYVCLVLSEHVFRILRALVGFRTVVVYVGPPPDFSTGHKENDEQYIEIAREIEEEMVPTMGPITVRQVGLRTYLEFHPLEHMQADLRAQVDNSGMKMSKLSFEADEPEQGVWKKWRGWALANS